MVQVVERVCGICSCIHAHNYCMCIEDLLGVEVPPIILKNLRKRNLIQLLAIFLIILW